MPTNAKTLQNVGRQEVILSSTKIPFGTVVSATNPNELVVSAAGVYPVLQLPAGAVVLRGYLATTDATSAGVTVAIGTTVAPTSLLAATSVAATGSAAITPTTAPLTSTTNYVATVVGTPVLTGEAYLVVEYFVQNRTIFSQG